MSVRIGSMERDETTGEIRVDIHDQDEMKSMFKELLQAPIGKVYLADYWDANRDDSDAIIAQAARAAGRDMVSLYDLGAALKALMHANVIPKKLKAKRPVITEPAETVGAPTVPVDKNNKPLSTSQLKWKEYREWSETASASEVNLRRRNDPDGYGAYVRKSLEHEMAGEIGDAVRPKGLPTNKVKADAKLTEFARRYSAEPSQNLKPRNGVVLLAGEQIPHAQFLELVNAATNARLL